MDEAVKVGLVKRICLCLALTVTAWNAALAQALQDPTRPPAALMAGQGASSQAAAAAERGPQLPQLQSVLIARQPGGRHVAVIDGETLRLGDSFRGARVTRIEQNEVELVRGRTRQVLKLNPAAAPHAGAIERSRTE
jgi:MSHA biogenesis protein MshK